MIRESDLITGSIIIMNDGKELIILQTASGKVRFHARNELSLRPRWATVGYFIQHGERIATATRSKQK